MKSEGCILVLLISVSLCFAADINPNVLDYPLEIIDYLLDNHIGTFGCIFWDIAPNSPVLSDLMKSPMLQYVTKYVVKGSYRSEHLPKHPSLLVIHPGSIDDLYPLLYSNDIYRLLFMFNPTTKVFVFWDIYDKNVFPQMRWALFQSKYNNVIFFDTANLVVILNSLPRFTVEEDDLKPHPANSLKWLKDQLRGSTLYYVRDRKSERYHPKFKWLMVLADYIDGRALEYRGNDAKDTSGADIFLETNYAFVSLEGNFRQFFDYTPEVSRVLVPRGRPLNAVEIMVMPFDWKVWTMLVIVLLSTEVAKRFLPDVFQNDPVMLVLFGFERYNLHRAGRSERIILQSLIILMFFVTSAFETKIVSLMINKPSAPTALKLKDFDKYGLKFRYDLDSNPKGVEHPVTGKYLVNGPKVELWETVPGIAKYVTQDMVDLVPKVSYDFERGRSWFVALEERFNADLIYIHRVGFRSPYMEIFRFTHDALVEAGFMRLWWRQASDLYWLQVWGAKRARGKIEENFLTFNDLLLAWIILAFGSCVSFMGFIVEIMRKKFESKSVNVKKFFDKCVIICFKSTCNP